MHEMGTPKSETQLHTLASFFDHKLCNSGDILHATRKVTHLMISKNGVHHHVDKQDGPKVKMIMKKCD